MAIVITGTSITAPDGAIDAADLTGDIDASLLTGTLPAIDGSALTGVGGSTGLADVGTYILGLVTGTPPATSAGATWAGSVLNYVALNGGASGSPSVGTWRQMGQINGSIYGGANATLFVRIS